MTNIEWQSTYEIGISRLDEDHRQFVALINQLEKHAYDRQAEAQEVIIQLIKMSIPHFAAEEQLMAENQCPFTDHHAALHQGFFSHLAGILRKLKVDGSILVQEFIAFLKSWLINHIMREDGKLRAYNRPNIMIG